MKFFFKYKDVKSLININHENQVICYQYQLKKYILCIPIFGVMHEFNNMVLLVWNFEKKKQLVQLNSQV